MKKKVFLAGALLALMAVGAFAQTYTAESNFQVTKTATAVTITRYVGNQSISAVNIPPTIQNLPVTTIAGNVFTAGRGNVTSLTIPNSVTRIQPTAFYELVSLTSVTFLGPIPSRGLDDRAFAGDLAAKFYATDRNNGTPGTYTRSGSTWTLTPAATSTPAQTPNPTPDGIEWMQTADGRGIIISMYLGTATTVRIPDRINNLPVVEIGEQAFNSVGGVTRMTSITIPNTVTKIGITAFSGQPITSITLPSSLIEIGNNAFQGCGLTSITLPASVRTIGTGAFATCRALTSVSLPASITTIGNDAFRLCTALTTVTIPASVTRITFGTNVFTGATKLDAASKTALQRVGYTGAF